jgi:hypothetical protein
MGRCDAPLCPRAAGKTLAFLLPVVEKLYRARWSKLDGLGALIISPTRELALQVAPLLSSRPTGPPPPPAATSVATAADIAPVLALLHTCERPTAAVFPLPPSTNPTLTLTAMPPTDFRRAAQGGAPPRLLRWPAHRRQGRKGGADASAGWGAQPQRGEGGGGEEGGGGPGHVHHPSRPGCCGWCAGQFSAVRGAVRAVKPSGLFPLSTHASHAPPTTPRRHEHPGVHAGAPAAAHGRDPGL